MNPIRRLLAVAALLGLACATAYAQKQPDRQPPEDRAAEEAARGALDSAKPPHDLAFDLAVLSFPDRGHPGRTAIVVHPHTTSPAVLVIRVTPPSGEVDTLSGGRSDGGPMSWLDTEMDLRAGVSTIAAALVDPVTRAAGVRFVTVEVPAAAPGPFVSSLFRARDAVKIKDPDMAVARVVFKSRMVLPDPRTEIQQGNQLNFAFAVTAIPERAIVSATAAILKDGTPVSTAPIELGPVLSGRLQYLGHLPTRDFAPGTYQLGVTIDVNGTKTSRLMTFRVVGK